MRFRTCSALLLLLPACATTAPSPNDSVPSIRRIANLQKAAQYPWMDDGHCVVREASNEWEVLAKRCFHALDQKKIRFQDVTGRCALASAGAAVVGVGICIFAAPEIIVGAIIITGAVVVAVAIKEELEAYERRASRERAGPKTQTQPTSQNKNRLGPDGIPLPYDPDSEPDKNKEKLGRIYVAYTKFNNKTKRFYSGRTSMVIDLNKPHRPQAVKAVEQRDKNHHIEDENPEPKDFAFDPARPDEFDVGIAVNYNDRYRDLAYWRIRGREQQLIDRFGGAWSDTGEPYKTENSQRGVAKDNVNGRKFYDAATKKWGKISEYTGD